MAHWHFKYLKPHSQTSPPRLITARLFAGCMHIIASAVLVWRQPWGLVRPAAAMAVISGVLQRRGRGPWFHANPWGRSVKTWAGLGLSLSAPQREKAAFDVSSQPEAACRRCEKKSLDSFHTHTHTVSAPTSPSFLVTYTQAQTLPLTRLI